MSDEYIFLPRNVLEKCIREKKNLSASQLGKLVEFVQTPLYRETARRRILQMTAPSPVSAPVSALPRPTFPLKSLDENPRIGIGITTFRRPDMLAQCTAEFAKFMPPNTTFMINDDSEREEGIARAKNRCIDALKDCDYIFLVDDDCWPKADKWWVPFINHAIRYNCHYFSPSWTGTLIPRGDDLIEVQNPNGVVQFLTSHSVRLSGGFCPAFMRHGGEHEDYAVRCYRNSLTPYSVCDFKGSLDSFYSYDKDHNSEHKSSIAWGHIGTREKEIEAIQTLYTCNWLPISPTDIIFTFYIGDCSEELLEEWVSRQEYPVIFLCPPSTQLGCSLKYANLHRTDIITFIELMFDYFDQIYFIDYHNDLPTLPVGSIYSFPISTTSSSIISRIPKNSRRAVDIYSHACIGPHSRSELRTILSHLNHPTHYNRMFNAINSSQISFTPVDCRPVLMILGCEKYIKSLELAVERFKSDSYTIVAVTGGGSELIYNPPFLILPVSDTYDDLAKKVYSAFEWIYAHFPQTVGVFKTDEDIVLDNMVLFEKVILDNHSLLFWGLKTEKVEGGIVDSGKIDEKFATKEYTRTYPASHYCYGHGYWLSRLALRTILKHKTEYDWQHLEDVCTGSCLNRYGITPVEFPIKYTEADREALLEGRVVPQRRV
jgi:hypothetical protein